MVDITLNTNNTCSFKDNDYKIDTTGCTFEIKKYSERKFGKYVSGYHIIGQKDKYLSVVKNNSFTDTRFDVISELIKVENKCKVKNFVNKESR